MFSYDVKKLNVNPEGIYVLKMFSTEPSYVLACNHHNLLTIFLVIINHDSTGKYTEASLLLVILFKQ